MRALWFLPLLAACGGEGSGVQPFSSNCKTDYTSPISDTTGTFELSGPSDAPSRWGVGTAVGGTGSLVILACVRSLSDEILDDLVLQIELVLFDIDDQAIDLPVGSDASGTNVLWGSVADWADIVSWDDGTFMSFEGGTSSWSELDKQGRLVGTIDVTETDPPGTPMTIDVDLSW